MCRVIDISEYLRALTRLDERDVHFFVSHGMAVSASWGEDFRNSCADLLRTKKTKKHWNMQLKMSQITNLRDRDEQKSTSRNAQHANSKRNKRVG